MNGRELPRIATTVPGPESRAHTDRLAAHECPAITARRARRATLLGAADDDPIVWDQAVGAVIVDVDGNRYVDTTSGFGVALIGHRHPDVVAAAHAQTERLVHAMGDAYPDASRIALLERLAAVTPGDLSASILGLSGSDAVDAAIKTAVLATGRTGVLTFDRAYHGLSLGVLALQAYNTSFTEPFSAIAHPDVTHLPWGCAPDAVATAMAQHPGGIGLVMLEPIQGRGGMHPAPDGWLAEVTEVARRHGALVAFDEVQSGCGRTGRYFACEDDGVTPDLICLGKALGGGFPISACIGTPEVMNAWGASTGQAIHTQTFLGHPVGCAAALATLDVLEHGGLGRIRRSGSTWRDALTSSGFTVRGRGLMMGVEIGVNGLAASRGLLQRGVVALPAGPTSLGLTPPMCVTDAQVGAVIDALCAVVAELA